MAQPRILQSAPAHMRVTAPFGAVALEPGDLCSYESDTIVLMDAAAENVTFCGYLINQHNTADDMPDTGVLGLQGQLLVDCDSAAYVLGQGLKASGTSGNKVVDHGGTPADTICWSAEKTGTVTSLKVIIDVIQIAQLFEAPVV